MYVWSLNIHLGVWKSAEQLEAAPPAGLSCDHTGEAQVLPGFHREDLNLVCH